jgi:hypothetical protein
MRFGFFKRRHEIEKKQIMGRLAAVETLALMDRNIEQTADSDTAAAVTRIKKVLGSYLTDDEAEDYLAVLLSHLRNSELNINFRAFNFFAAKPADKYATKFEVMRTAGAPMCDTRDQVEELMFHYSAAGSSGGSSSNAGWAAAQQRVSSLGPLESADFAGIIRPRYCTLNFASVKDGFGAQWGRSHFKLKDHLKLNMSFTHEDSFGLWRKDSTPQSVQANVATYHNMTRLICNMSDVMFDMLIDAAAGHLGRGRTSQDLQQEYKYGTTMYIEGHIHAEILFGRDIDEIRVCRSELNNNALFEKNLDRFVAKHKMRKVMFN